MCNLVRVKKIFEECHQGKATQNREALLKILENLSSRSKEAGPNILQVGPAIGASPNILQVGPAIGASPNIPQVGQKRVGNGAATGYSTEDDSCDEQEGVVAVKKFCSAQGSGLVNANYEIDSELVSSVVANTKELLIWRPKWIELRKTELDMESKARQEEAQAVKASIEMKSKDRQEEAQTVKAKMDLESKAREEEVQAVKTKMDLESKAREEEVQAAKAKMDMEIQTAKANMDIETQAAKAKMDMEIQTAKANMDIETQAAKAKMDMEAQAAKARDEERAKELEFLRAKAKIEADARVAVQVSAPVDIPVPQPKTLWTIKEVALKEGIIKYLQRAIQNRILAIVGKHFHGRASPTEKVVEGNLLVYQYHMSLYDEIKAELQKTCDNICNPAGQTKLSFARAE